MKRLSLNLLTNVMLLLAGILLIVFCNVPNVMTWVARIIGVLFALPALAFLMLVAAQHSHERTGTALMGVLPAIGGMCFGIIMLLKPQLFDTTLRFLMGVMLLALGFFHIIYLLLSRHCMRVRGWYFVCPLLVALCGFLSLYMPALRERTSVVVMLTGISLLLFNFTSLQEYLAQRRWTRNHREATTSDDNSISSNLPADDTATVSTDDYLPAIDNSREDSN